MSVLPVCQHLHCKCRLPRHLRVRGELRVGAVAGQEGEGEGAVHVLVAAWRHVGSDQQTVDEGEAHTVEYPPPVSRVNLVGPDRLRNLHARGQGNMDEAREE